MATRQLSSPQWRGRSSLGPNASRLSHLYRSLNRMARQTHITPSTKVPIIVRMASPEFAELCTLVFRRYPDLEWASFARFGYREPPHGLVLTLAGLDSPVPGDLDELVGHVKIAEPYTLRMALGAEKHPLAVGIIHSHPEGCRPQP